MASTIKVTNIGTPDNTGNITVDRPLAGSGASLTSLPAANLTGTLPAISGANLTNLPAPSSLAATALTGAITATANGEVVMSSQPAFSAKLSAQQTNLAAGATTTIQCNTEIFDQNADYNTSTYTFTAPVTGKYQVNANLQLINVDSANTEYMDIWIVTTNRTYRNLFDPQQQLNADAYYFNLNFSVLADMDANDTVYMAAKPHNGAAQTDVDSDWTYFSAYLAC